MNSFLNLIGLIGNLSFFLVEEPVNDPTIRELSDREEVITYEKIEKGTKRGGTKLVDNLGFQYNVKRKYKTTVHWQCSVRPQVNPCKAVVLEQVLEGQYVRKSIHNHQTEVGAGLAAKIITAVKEEAKSNVFKPASTIVREVNIKLLTPLLLYEKNDM